MYEPWQLVALEEYGYIDTREGILNRIARYLAKTNFDGVDNIHDIDIDNIDAEDFEKACVECGVDPSTLTQEDREKINRKLKIGV